MGGPLGELGWIESPSRRPGRGREGWERLGVHPRGMEGVGPSWWDRKDWQTLPDSREVSGGEGEDGRISRRAGRGLGTLSESCDGLGWPEEVGSWEVIQEGWEGS